MGYSHAHSGCLKKLAHPADASTAWRPSPHTALEPQPHPGALAGAAAGPAGRAVETPYADAAALSNAPGIEVPSTRRPVQMKKKKRQFLRSQPCSAKRPRRMGLCSEVADDGENLEDHPRLASRYVRRKAPFQRADRPANSSRVRVEPFSFRPDKTLPGTLHHSGIRPAPPSDHTPLARRSAFQHGRKPARREIWTRPRG